MHKFKIMTVVGTRPEIIRLSRIVALLDQHCEHILVHTGQNFDYELNQIFFDELGIRKPDEFMNAAAETPAETIGQIIAKADRLMAQHAPQAILVLGDTNSCLAVIAAKRRKIPIFHMEAGNRCFDYRVPEEINRRIVDHTADINLPYSQIARDYLLREGFPPERVIVTGSPLREVIEYYGPRISASNVLAELQLEQERYFLVSVHREENVDAQDRLSKVLELLQALDDRYGLPIIVSTHPRTRNRLLQLGAAASRKNIVWHKPFGFLDYVHLQTKAKCVLSDSGTITEESSILNFPALNLRETHERPEGMEEGSVMMVGLNPERALQALEILASQPHGAVRDLRMVADYAPENVSAKILRIILSYTDFVNQNVWRLSSAPT